MGFSEIREVDFFNDNIELLIDYKFHRECSICRYRFCIVSEFLMFTSNLSHILIDQSLMLSQHSNKANGL